MKQFTPETKITLKSERLPESGYFRKQIPLT